MNFALPETGSPVPYLSLRRGKTSATSFVSVMPTTMPPPTLFAKDDTFTSGRKTVSEPIWKK